MIQRDQHARGSIGGVLRRDIHVDGALGSGKNFRLALRLVQGKAEDFAAGNVRLAFGVGAEGIIFQRRFGLILRSLPRMRTGLPMRR